MAKTKTIEEKVKFKDMPTVTTVSELPTGIWVLRINLPFTLRHLAQREVPSAFIRATTGKSVNTFLKEEKLTIQEIRDKLKEKIEDTHPSLRKRVGIAISARLNFGAKEQMTFVKDIPRLHDDMAKLGISELPLRMFAIPLENPSPMWATFIKRKEAFICIQIGSQSFADFDAEELQLLRDTNKILQDLNAYVCETIEKTGTWLSCKIPSKEAK